MFRNAPIIKIMLCILDMHPVVWGWDSFERPKYGQQYVMIAFVAQEETGEEREVEEEEECREEGKEGAEE